MQIESEIVSNVSIGKHQMLEISFFPLSFILHLGFVTDLSNSESSIVIIKNLEGFYFFWRKFENFNCCEAAIGHFYLLKAIY